MQPLIPIPDFKFGFTTCNQIRHPKIQLLRLDDHQLGVHKVSSRTTHQVVQPPNSNNLRGIPPPDTAWEAFYPEGSINPSADISGGFSFYLSGPQEFADRLETASEVVMSYRMMLQDEWEWKKGGKLPGIFGGVGELSYGCSGGRKEHRFQCFNLRPMWRTGSVAELYTYLPLTPENAECLKCVPPRSIENSDYGFSVGRGAFHLDVAVGQWMAVALRIKLNNIGSNNGQVQLWIDGNSVIDVDGLCLRETEAGKVKGMHFQTFFGGHDEDWASPKDQRAWFADITGTIIR